MSVLIYIFQIGLNSFIENLFVNLAYLFIGFAVAFFNSNWCNAILYIVLGKLFNLKIAALNLYPLFIVSNKVNFSVSIIKFAQINNAYSLNNVSLKNIQSFKNSKEKSKKVLDFFEICSIFLFLLLGFVLNNSFFVMIFSILYLKLLISQSFNEIDYFSEDERMLFYEYHLHYVLENIVNYINKPEKMNSINLLLFAYFNNTQSNKECLKELDKAIIQLVQTYGNKIDIACRDTLFDYEDNRIVLDTLSYEEEFLISFLDFYITFGWNIELPNIYFERVKELKMYIKGNYNKIKFPKGYEIYLSL